MLQGGPFVTLAGGFVWIEVISSCLCADAVLHWACAQGLDSIQKTVKRSIRLLQCIVAVPRRTVSTGPYTKM